MSQNIVTAAEQRTLAYHTAERAFYNISQAAAVLGVSRVTIWRWISAGHMPVSRLGHRTARIQRADIERLISQRQISSQRHQWPDIGPGEHVAQFYEGDDFLLDAVSQFIHGALSAGNAGVVVATAAHRAGVEDRLRRARIDLEAARESGAYTSLDAAETLTLFMDGERVDIERFEDVIGNLIATAEEDGRQVRVFGEMVALLARNGQHVAAVELEAAWNELQRKRSFALFCAYPIEYFNGQELSAALDGVCAEHGRIVPAESFTGLDGPDERLRAVAALQQKARSLKAEVERREHVEDQLRIALASERAAREAAEAALRLRDEFMSIASHELKTPLTTLSGHAQLVLRRFRRDGELDTERAVHALQAITGQADKLGRLMGHLLDVSRLEEGRLRLEVQHTDVAELVEHLVSSARVWSEYHPISLVSPQTLEVEIDSLRFEQVVTNLLDNAVKYSPEGRAIEVTLAEHAQSFELAVRDHGLGIPRERRPHIFERFYQAHSGSYHSGLGLGLYISRQIIELHGGQIRAEFPRGGGTRLVVRLPKRAAARPRPR